MGYLERGGHDVETAPVGDRAISHALLASGGIFGAEESGHYVFMGDHIAGDGIFAALSLLRLTDGNLDIVLKYADKRILLPEARANVVVKNKVASGEEELLPIRETIRYAETKLDGVGRILVRPSGTEPKYRVFVEAAKQELADALVSQIAGVIAKARG